MTDTFWVNEGTFSLVDSMQSKWEFHRKLAPL